MKSLLLLLALLGATDALAQDPADALPPFVRTLYDEAVKREGNGDLRGAELRYKKVYDMQPSWKNVVQDLGRVREEQGDIGGAIRAYQHAPFEADAVESLARLYLRDDQPELAAPLFFDLRSLRPGTSEFLSWEAAATAHFDPEDADGIFRLYLNWTEADLGDPEIQQIALDLMNALYEDEDLAEQATTLREDVVARLSVLELEEGEDNSVHQAIMTLGEARDFERRAEIHMNSAGRQLGAEQLAELNRARAAFARKRVDEAAGILEEILRRNQSNAATWAALSAVREQQKRIAEAEQAIVMAEELSPLTGAYPARLGALLATWYGGRFDDEAIRAYRRALRRPGSNPQLWYELARVEQRGGSRDGTRSLRSLEKFLELAPDGPDAEEARQQIENLKRERPELLKAPEVDRPKGVSKEGWRAFHLAYVYFKAGIGLDDADEDRSRFLETALTTVHVSRARSADFVRAINLEAQIQVERGEPEQAVVLWEKSLLLDGTQAPVVLDLAEVHGALGNDARQEELLAQALELGDPVILYKNAKREEQAGEFWAARETLGRYFASAPPGTPNYPDALELSATVDRQIFVRYGGWGGAAGAVVIAPILLRWYRRSGVGVLQLLERSPAAYRDVARICSAIRHEVLKHNTTVLASVADAIDDGDLEPAKWAAEKLYGKRGAVVRFREYIAELELLGRVHGVGLNLRHRDVLFGPIIAAVDRLSKLERDLRNKPGRRTAAELRDISETLNETGYRGLGKLVQRVCLLELSADLLRSIFDEVRREPAFADTTGIPLTVLLPDEPVWLRIFQTDLEDILTNLLRNSLAVTLEVGSKRIGVLVDTEEDPITGLERVSLRVVDDGPRRISTAMIRGRYISRGLGLAVDLISRNAGSIHVEDENDWSKAVVVRLPSAEAGEE